MVVMKNKTYIEVAIMGMLYDYGYGAASSTGTIMLVLGILGIILGIVLLFVFLPAKNRGRYTGGAKWLYDFLNFNRYWLSSIIKVLYIAATVVCLLGGLICLFIIPLTGLIMFVSAIVVRLVYELIMVMLSIRENTAQLNDTMLRMAGGIPVQNQGYAPQAAPFVPSAPLPPVCANCGAENAPGSAFCIKCGSKI
jgi:hypothetical protein